MIRFSRSVITAYVTLLLLFAMGLFVVPMAIASLEIYLQKKPVVLNADLASIAVPLGPWDRTKDANGDAVPDGKLTAEMVEELGTDKYLDRLYSADGKNVNVHVAYYTGMIDDVPHVPERCWDAAGLEMVGVPEIAALEFEVPNTIFESVPTNLATGEPYGTLEYTDAIGSTQRIHLPVGEAAMTMSEFQPSKANPRERQIGGYFFIANGRIAPSARDVRLLAFNPNEEYAYYCKVQFSMRDRIAPGESDAAARIRFVEKVQEAMPHLLPEVMRCLPDWPSIERERKTTEPT